MNLQREIFLLMNIKTFFKIYRNSKKDKEQMENIIAMLQKQLRNYPEAEKKWIGIELNNFERVYKKWHPQPQTLTELKSHASREYAKQQEEKKRDDVAVFRNNKDR